MKTLKKQYRELKKENPNCVSFNHYLTFNLVRYMSIENLFLPVFIDGKKVQFTNISFHENSSGDDFYLILVGNTYKFFKFYYEPDCDGAYYGGYITKLFDVTNLTQYQLIEVYTNDLIKTLNSI